LIEGPPGHDRRDRSRRAVPRHAPAVRRTRRGARPRLRWCASAAAAPIAR